MNSPLRPGKEWQSTWRDSFNLTASNRKEAVPSKQLEGFCQKINEDRVIIPQAKATHGICRAIRTIMHQLKLYYYVMEKCLWYNVDCKPQRQSYTAFGSPGKHLETLSRLKILHFYIEHTDP